MLSLADAVTFDMAVFLSSKDHIYTVYITTR